MYPLLQGLAQAFKDCQCRATAMGDNVPELDTVVPETEAKTGTPTTAIHMHMGWAMFVTQHDDTA